MEENRFSTAFHKILPLVSATKRDCKYRKWIKPLPDTKVCIQLLNYNWLIINWFLFVLQVRKVKTLTEVCNDALNIQNDPNFRRRRAVSTKSYSYPHKHSHEDWQLRLWYFGDLTDSGLQVKTSGACFFNAPIRLNRTTNTLIPDCPTRFLFLAPNCKYLDDVFPDPDHPAGIHLNPQCTGHWPNRSVVRNVSCSCLWLICHLLFVGAISVHHFITIKI